MAEEKLTFAQVRDQEHFSIVDLAKSAGVGTVVVYKMLLNQPVERAHAVDVLYALSLNGGNYNLDTVNVAISEQDDRQLLM